MRRTRSAGRRGRARRMVSMAALLAFLSAAAHAQGQLINAGAMDTRDLYLEVDVNGQRTAQIVHFRQLGGHLFASGDDLSQVGVATAQLGIANSANVDLDSLPGLHYRYDAQRQTLELQIPDAIRKPFAFDTRAVSAIPAATSARGLVFNYDAFAQAGSASEFALWSEERYFDPKGVLSNTGVAYLYHDRNEYVRYDTSWSTSNATNMSTTQIGDTISSSLAWTRSIRMAGLQYRSNFALRPDLVTFPTPALPGSAVVPTSVDLYINSVRQYSGNVPSGPFIINDVPGITGAGQATVITHDALGRTISAQVPLYVDTRLMAQGLSSYSFEAGFLRRNYGLDSFDYDTRPAVSASWRHGLNDHLTFEAHGEATGGLVNAGGGVLFGLGTAGVLNGSLSGSGGKFNGAQLSLGYQYVSQRFSVDAQTIRAYGNFGDLGSRDGSPVPDITDRVTLAVPFLRNQTFSVSYIGYKIPSAPVSQIGSVAWTFNFGNLVSLNLSAYQDFRQHDSRGVLLSASIGLGGNASINATVGRQDGASTWNINALRPPDYAGGWGWGVQTGGTGSTSSRQGQLQYLGRYGEATASVQQVGGQTIGSLDLTGAVVVMDQTVQPARRIDDGFALVSTDGVAGIPVLHENRVIGVTDGGGHLLIPDLNAYQHNQVAIDSMRLPAAARIDDTAMDIVPQSQSGVLAHFGVTRYHAASIIVHDGDGKPLPAGARVHHVESGHDTIVGYDGLTFVDGLAAQNHLQIESGDKHCEVSFAWASDKDDTLQTIGPLVCRLQGQQGQGAQP
ncbi:fimbria/pilus outer membrane usher protein [Paraburkholderia sp. J67]|uniref:fimbria/pilus outer membrane usher protein n=1 Tax=Paraburkholderia sp. J67 TaxID=2805435 RepID=UPI002ABDA831|nr:fimbria/pilus outer membrane usher protein [Paraburkholderia sp. J67]